MNLAEMSAAQIDIAAVVLVIVVASTGAWLFMRKRRTDKLRAQFGGAEYTRAVEEGGSQRKAERALGERAERVKSMNIRPLTADDRTRFVDSWTRIQARFV